MDVLDLTNCDIVLNRSPIGLVHLASRRDVYSHRLRGSAGVRWRLKHPPTIRLWLHWWICSDGGFSGPEY